MKELLLGTILLLSAIVIPNPTTAEVRVSIGISLPPPIIFQAPPDVIAMPDTIGVYVVPDIDADFFFWSGWWWRLWDGRWYRSHYYDRGWGYYDRVPTFYFDIDPGWRGYYRDHNWYGHRWNYERIPNQRLQQNWKSWNNTRYWERQATWGVQGYQPRPEPQRRELRQQRQVQYQQRPDVQQHQQQRQEQQRQPGAQQPQQVQQPQRHEQAPQVQQPQREPQQQHQPQPQQPPREQQSPQQQSQPGGQQRQGESQHQKSQGRSEGGDGEHRN
jgi:hypothetical protein